MWVYGVCRICIIDCSDRLSLLGLLGIVEFDVAFQHRCSLISRFLSQALLLLLYFFLIRRRDDTPTSPPRRASAESNSCPIFIPNSRPVHDDFDIVEQLAFASYQ